MLDSIFLMFSAFREVLLRLFPLLRCKGRDFILNCQIVIVYLTIVNRRGPCFDRAILLVYIVYQGVGCCGVSDESDWERFVRKKC